MDRRTTGNARLQALIHVSKNNISIVIAYECAKQKVIYIQQDNFWDSISS